jgi:hypothetical protein
MKWIIDNEDAVRARFERLMKGIRQSEPDSIRAALEGAERHGTYGWLHPEVAWSPDQRLALGEAIFAQVPILVARMRNGSLLAYWALIGMPSSDLFDEEQKASLEETLDTLGDQLERHIEDLLLDAVGGEDAALKVVLDLCARVENSPLTASVVADYLPEEMSLDDLRALVARYRQNMAEKGLPELPEVVFDEV